MNIPNPKVFGSQNAREAHNERVARALSTQTVPFAVAPGSFLETSRGQLGEGDEVRLADVSGLVNMNELIQRGHVLAQSEETLRALLTPADAEFKVARRALSTKRGILAPGEQLFEADVDGGRDQLLYLADRGHVLHTARTGPEAA